MGDQILLLRRRQRLPPHGHLRGRPLRLREIIHTRTSRLMRLRRRIHARGHGPHPHFVALVHRPGIGQNLGDLAGQLLLIITTGILARLRFHAPVTADAQLVHLSVLFALQNPGLNRPHPVTRLRGGHHQLRQLVHAHVDRRQLPAQRGPNGLHPRTRGSQLAHRHLSVRRPLKPLSPLSAQPLSLALQIGRLPILDIRPRQPHHRSPPP